MFPQVSIGVCATLLVIICAREAHLDRDLALLRYVVDRYNA